MKKLLILAALVCGTAQADTVAIMRNNGGGIMVLTDLQTPECRSFVGAVYTMTSRNETLWGCWFSDDLMVHVRWSDGDTRAYPVSGFEVHQRNATRLREKHNRGGNL